jgi:hypothetical protein
MPNSVYSRTMHKAAQLAGGEKKLARYLRVPLAELQKWIAGKDVPPTAHFLKAIDLVLEETSPNATGSEPGEPPPANDCAAMGGSSYRA